MRNDLDRKPVKMTPSLQILQASRAAKTEKDVEDEFRMKATELKLGDKSGSPIKKVEAKIPEYEGLNAELDGDSFGFQREKSKNLMLNS